jgi:hypothetical protein
MLLEMLEAESRSASRIDFDDAGYAKCIWVPARRSRVCGSIAAAGLGDVSGLAGGATATAAAGGSGDANVGRGTIAPVPLASFRSEKIAAIDVNGACKLIDRIDDGMNDVSAQRLGIPCAKTHYPPGPCKCR